MLQYEDEDSDGDEDDDEASDADGNADVEGDEDYKNEEKKDPMGFFMVFYLRTRLLMFSTHNKL